MALRTGQDRDSGPSSRLSPPPCGAAWTWTALAGAAAG